MKGKSITKKITLLAINNIEPNGDLEQLLTEEANKLEGGGEINTEQIRCDLGCAPNTDCTPPINYVCKPNA